MPHAFYPRAAVAIDRLAGSLSPNPEQAVRSTGPRPLVLWASRPLAVRGGRLVGVRLKGTELEVAFVAAVADGLRWVSASAVLSNSQADLWSKTSTFNR